MAVFSLLMSSSLPLLAAALVLATSLGSVRSDFASDRAECEEEVVGLATCLTYVEGSARSPTPDCCAGLKQVLSKSPKCLCVLIRDRDEPALGIKINATRALALPSSCQSPADISQCPKLLNLPPNSKDAEIFKQAGSASAQGSGGPSGKAEAGAAISLPTHAGKGWGSSDYLRRGNKWLGVEVVGGVWACPLLLVALLVMGG